MSVFQALILGILQGLTEFLPVSSSGHLVLGQSLLGFSKPPVTFDVLIHVGTLTAIIIFFKEELVKDTRAFFRALFFCQFNKIPKIYRLVIIGTIPTAVVGFLTSPFLEKIFNSTLIVGFSLIFTSLFLFSTKFIKESVKKLNKASLADGLFIGLFQSLAILPGISRSGSTVVSGLWRGLKRKDAFKFSFYLAIPAILGAQILEIKKLIEIANGMMASYLLGFISAMLAGVLSLKILKKMVIKGKLAYFAIYCFAVGSMVIIISL